MAQNNQGLLITLSPTKDKASPSEQSNNIKNQIKEAGFVSLTDDEIKEAGDFIPEGYDDAQLTSALLLFAKGASGESLEKETDKLKTLGTISEFEANELYRVAYFVSAFEETEKSLANNIFASEGEPTLSIQQTPIGHKPGENHLLLGRGKEIFAPVKQLVGTGVSFVKQKVKQFALKAIKKGGKKLIQKGAKIAAKAGIKVAEAAGIAIPVVGEVIAALEIAQLVKKGISLAKRGAAKLLQKITGEKDTRKSLFALGVILAAGGLALGSAIVAGAGIFMATVSGVSIVGGVGVATGIGGVFQTIVYGVVGIAATYITPFVIAILAVPLLIAFFLFIINSGAYLVPHSPALLYAQQQYINVEKEGDPNGPFDNSDLPQRITYTITVIATQSTLTDISFEHECRVLRENNPPSCPEPLPDEVPTLITTTEPFTFTYTARYRNRFTDSAVINTFTVTGTTPEGEIVSASGTETIIFGDPPLGCFVFEPEDAPYISEFQAAAAEVASHVSYAAKLCAAGDITVTLNTDGPSTTGACAGANASSMFFDNCLYFQTYGQDFITYLFAHESGHTYHGRNPNEFNTFQATNVMSEGGLPTYCIQQPPPPHEDFADTIGDYIDNGRLRHLCRHDDQRPFNICGGGWPLHCDFARNIIFEE